MMIKVSLYTLPREALIVVLIAKSKRVVMMRKNSA